MAPAGMKHNRQLCLSALSFRRGRIATLRGIWLTPRWLTNWLTGVLTDWRTDWDWQTGTSNRLMNDLLTWLTDSLASSMTDWLTDWLTLTHRQTNCLTNSDRQRFWLNFMWTDRLTHWLPDFLTTRLTDWLTDWLWLADRQIDPPPPHPHTHTHTHSPFYPFTPEWSISSFPCSLTNITSHSVKNVSFHSLRRWEVVILSTNSHCVTEWQVGRILEPGSKRVGQNSMPHRLIIGYD